MFSSKLLQFLGQSSAQIKRFEHTIFGLSSGFGKCGVAVVRVSGPKSLDVVKTVASFKSGSDVKPRHAYLKKFTDPRTNEMIDKGLVLWFPGPNSFTGEDSCEFQVHGGPAIISAMLDALGAMKGLRAAQRGEFTKRAFYAGKLDLTEVEGLADLIHAETEYQRKQALLQANGALSALYSNWRQRLLKCTAHLEAYIDFAEDQNIESDTFTTLQSKLHELIIDITMHLRDGRRGEILRDGVRTVILGAPNVGKSSFMNRICCKPISIVTDVAGTTRDVVESAFNIGGFPVVFADTAGLRLSTEDVVEREGISRAMERAKLADLVILVADARDLERCDYDYVQFYGEYLTKLGLVTKDFPMENQIVLLNKIDLIDRKRANAMQLDKNVSLISCTDDEGIDGAIDTLTKHLERICGDPSAEHPNLSQQRHRQHITDCLNQLLAFQTQFLTGDEGLDLAIGAHKLRLALRSIGQITGEASTEDILDVIFKDFCIGK